VHVLSERGQIRLHGLRLVGIGGAILAAWMAIVFFVWSHGRVLWGPGLGAPGVLFLVGLVEVVSGRSFVALARAWDDLRGWQRFVLGVVIVAIAFAVFVIIGGVVAMALV
jgi:hypothetical protein